MLDISGSMSGSRIRFAKNAIKNLIKKFKSDDHFAFGTFNDNSNNLIPLSSINSDNIEQFIKIIDEINAVGGTELMKGLRNAAKQLESSTNKNKRVIMITDMDYYIDNKDELKSLVKSITEKGIYISILCISPTGNDSLAELVAYERGCNYYVITNSKDIEKHLVKEFNYICFPCNYKQKLTFVSNDMKIKECYGIGKSINTKLEEQVKQYENKYKDKLLKNKEMLNEMKNLLMCCKRRKIKVPNPVCECIYDYLRYQKIKVYETESTFPSDLNYDFNNKTYYSEGGLILIKVLPMDYEDFIPFRCMLILEYQDYYGKHYSQNYNVEFYKNDEKEYYSSRAIEDGISLCYYVSEIKKLFSEQNKRNEDIKNAVKNYIINHLKNNKYSENVEKYTNRLDDIFNNRSNC